MRKFFPYLSVLFLAGVMGLANALLNPNAPPRSEDFLAEGEITLQNALLIEGILWVDARAESEFMQGSIPEAILLNEDSWDSLLPDFLSAWQPDQTVIVYCSSQTCQASHSLADRLKSELGMDKVFVLKGGWEAWQEYHQ